MHAGRTRELPLPEVIRGPLKGNLPHVPVALFSLTATRACTDSVCVCSEPVIANCKTLGCTQDILLAVSQIILLLSPYDVGGVASVPCLPHVRGPLHTPHLPEPTFWEHLVPRPCCLPFSALSTTQPLPAFKSCPQAPPGRAEPILREVS